MEENVQYTRCPQCQTAFKVTEKLLGMAKGKVRCGACLAVFQATEHLVKPSAAQKSPESSLPSEPIEKPSTQSSNTADTPIPEEPLGDSHQASIKETHSQVEVEKKNQQHSGESTLAANAGSEAEVASDLSANSEQSTISENEVEDKASFDAEPSIAPDLATDIDRDLESDLEPDLEDDPQLSLDDEEMDIDAALDGMEMATDDEFAVDELEENEFEVSDSDMHEGKVGELSDQKDLIEEVPSQEARLEPSADEEDILADAFEHDLDSQDLDAHDLDTQDIDSHDIEDELDFADAALDDLDGAASSETPLSEDNLALSEENLAHSENRVDGLEETRMEEPELGDSDLDEFEMDERDSESSDLDFESGFEMEEDSDLDNLDADPQIQEDELGDMDVDLLADNLTSQIEDADTEPDPLDEFEERVEKKKTGLRNGVIAATSVILLGILFYQFWQNRQELSWDPTWGGLTKSVCNLLPCELKPRRDVKKLRLRQRIVSPSDTKENVLQVKILLVNEAEFAQPYPTIQIRFSNTEGKQMAIKQFLPAEYFPEKAAELIPSDTEVHISFETEQPHPDANGFEFIFK